MEREIVFRTILSDAGTSLAVIVDGRVVKSRDECEAVAMALNRNGDIRKTLRNAINTERRAETR